MSKEKSTVKNLLTITISFLLAVFFMWIALRGLDFDKIKESLSKANYMWVLVSVFFGIMAYWIRAVRWNILFQPMGYKIKNSNGLWAISFGYLMNLTIPRSGEVARATALYGVEKIPVEKSFATIVIERIVDLLCMLIFLVLTFITNRQVLYSFFDNIRNYKSAQQSSSLDIFLTQQLGIQNLSQFYFVVKILLLIGIVLILIFAYIKFKNKVIDFVKGLWEGILSVKNIEHKGKFILLSTGIWVCYYLAAYIICFALEATSHFTISDGFLIITAGTLGMMVPTSGGAGSFHIAMKLAIAGIFISLGKSADFGEEVGLTYAFLSHTTQLVIMVVMGLISIPMLAKERKV